MKKQRKLKLPRISADELAKGLRRSMGDERALKLADYTAKNLRNIGIEDVNKDFFDIKDIRRDAQTWTQARNILAK